MSVELADASTFREFPKRRNIQDPPEVLQNFLARLGAFRIISQAVNLPTDAEIAAEKLTRYLLVKRPVGDKSEFLKQAGYTLDNWRKLEQDIRQQILSKEAVPTEQTPYGEYFEIRTVLTGPNRVALRVKTVWMKESKSGITKFITLYPDKGR